MSVFLPKPGRVRLRIDLAYQGTDFHGWQLQAPGLGQRTVQQCLEEALATLAGQPVRAHGAARTDSGVHALNQVAHADIPASRAHLPWQRALHALVPRDLTVTQAYPAPPGFHARFSATGKTYAYTISLNNHFVLPMRRHFVWQTGELDMEALDEAARTLTGRHDFAAFQNAGSNITDTVRHLTGINRRPGLFADEVVLEFEADGFLKQMVRNLTGLLVETGRGKVSLENVRSILEEKDRTRAPATAPARGLCLERVHYEDGSVGRRDLTPGGDHKSAGLGHGRDRGCDFPDQSGVAAE